MTLLRTFGIVVCSAAAAGVMTARADIQSIAPGTASQGSVVVDSGADGICDTTATPDDIQIVLPGTAAPFQTEIKCGADTTSNTMALGDDTQLVAVGQPCQNPNTAVVDTGPDGIADTMAAAGDTQVIPFGMGAPNATCIIAGPDGVANTTAAATDTQVLPVGTAEPNTAVVRCGGNKIADTAANNVIVGGDDVQLVAAGGGCANRNTVVVDSGANGIAETRAVGSELVLQVAKPVKLKIAKGRATVTKTVKLAVSNLEFGLPPPASRLYALVVTDGSCPNGTVGSVDADADTAGLQTSASIVNGGRLKGSFVVTMHLEDVTSVSSKIPFRCAVDVEADVIDDPNLMNAADDATNTDNNATPVDLEVTDSNDL
jgi:hypothetical protein